MTGTSPRPGNLLSASVTLFLIRPATTKLWPSPSCTVVSTRRVVIDGRIAVTPLMVEKGVPVCDSSDTSETTLRLTLPSRTVGVNFRPTPNSFSSRVMVVTPPVPSRASAQPG